MEKPRGMQHFVCVLIKYFEIISILKLTANFDTVLSSCLGLMLIFFKCMSSAERIIVQLSKH